MHYELLHKPDFTLVKIVFGGAGEQILAESAAMVAKDPGVDMKTQMTGGLMAAAKRRMLGGESIFQNTFTASLPGQRLYLAPGPEGDVEVVECQPHMPIFLSSAAFLASSPTVVLDTQWGGAKGFFSGAGLFLLKAQGSGLLFFASYGGIHTIDVGPSGYICDTSHIVGFSSELSYQVQTIGGIKSWLFGGEGLVCSFRGQGRLWISTRNAGALASFMHPFRRSTSN
jgi:uncharacterized protein (TIGR00266 family)